MMAPALSSSLLPRLLAQPSSTVSGPGSQHPGQRPKLAGLHLLEALLQSPQLVAAIGDRLMLTSPAERQPSRNAAQQPSANGSGAVGSGGGGGCEGGDGKGAIARLGGLVAADVAATAAELGDVKALQGCMSGLLDCLRWELPVAGPRVMEPGGGGRDLGGGCGGLALGNRGGWGVFERQRRALGVFAALQQCEGRQRLMFWLCSRGNPQGGLARRLIVLAYSAASDSSKWVGGWVGR